MKKFLRIGMAALILPLLFAFISCGDDGEDEESMTFVQDGKEFVINEFFEFTVTFTKPYANNSIPGVPVILAKGNNVSGSIASSGKWNEDFTGTIRKFTSNNPAVLAGAGVANGMAIKVSYTKDGENISKAVIGFVKPAGLDELLALADIAELAGEYQSKPTDQTVANALVQALIKGGYLQQTEASDSQKITTAIGSVKEDFVEALVEGGYLASADDAEDPAKMTAAVIEVRTQGYMFELCDGIVGGTYTRK